MKPSSLSFAMIGGGARANDHSQTLMTLGWTRRVVCDASKEVAEKHAARWKYSAMTTDYHEAINRKDVDVVVVVLPHSAAGQIVLDALKAGKHVLTEKPLCGTVTLGKEIVAEAERSGKVCMVSHNYRFERTVLAVRDAVSAGKIGEVFLAQGRLIGPPTYLATRPGYRTRTETNPSTVVLGNGVHGFDMLRFWLGEATSVSAVFRSVISKSLGGTGEDTGACRIEFRQGAVAQFTVSDADVSMASYTWQFDLYGTEGMLRWPDAILHPKHPECYEGWRQNRKSVEPVSLVGTDSKEAPTLDRIYGHLLGVIEGREKSKLSVVEGFKTLELTLAAVESAQNGGKTISV